MNKKHKRFNYFINIEAKSESLLSESLEIIVKNVKQGYFKSEVGNAAARFRYNAGIPGKSYEEIDKWLQTET